MDGEMNTESAPKLQRWTTKRWVMLGEGEVGGDGIVCRLNRTSLEKLRFFSMSVLPPQSPSSDFSAS